MEKQLDKLDVKKQLDKLDDLKFVKLLNKKAGECTKDELDEVSLFVQSMKCVICGKQLCLGKKMKMIFTDDNTLFCSIDCEKIYDHFIR